MNELQKYRIRKLDDLNKEATNFKTEIEKFPGTLDGLKEFILRNESSINRPNVNDVNEMERQMKFRRTLLKNQLNDIQTRFQEQKKNIETDIINFDNRNLESKVNDIGNDDYHKTVLDLQKQEISKIETVLNNSASIINNFNN